MIKLVLHYTGKVAPYPLFMFGEISILVFYKNTFRTLYCLMYARNGQTTFFRAARFAIVIIKDMRIYISAPEAFVFRKIF